MSLIIAFSVRDGIAVGSDKCTTHRENGRTSHSMDSNKIVVYPHRCVAVHCGDYFVDKNVSVQEFLESCSDIAKRSKSITDIPLAILNRYNRKKYKSDNTFFICGFDGDGNGAIYEIKTKTQSVSQKLGNHEYGGCWAGIFDIANPMLRSAQCDRISLTDAASLEKLAIEATGLSQLHCGVEITVGNVADVYVMTRNGDKDGWFIGGPSLHTEKGNPVNECDKS